MERSGPETAPGVAALKNDNGWHKGKKSLKPKGSQDITAETSPTSVGLQPDDAQIEGEPGSDIEREDVECAQNAALQLSCAIEILQHCVGRYEIATRCANGRPVWQRDGGSYWLYAGTDGKWYIADRQVTDCSFYCSFGFVRSTSADTFSVPKDTTQWEWWDGSDWQPEGTIKLQAASEVQGMRSASQINAQANVDGSFEVPEEGSRAHHQGPCTPCAWYFSPGCQQGHSFHQSHEVPGNCWSWPQGPLQPLPPGLLQGPSAADFDAALLEASVSSGNKARRHGKAKAASEPRSGKGRAPASTRKSRQQMPNKNNGGKRAGRGRNHDHGKGQAQEKGQGRGQHARHSRAKGSGRNDRAPDYWVDVHIESVMFRLAEIDIEERGADDNQGVLQDSEDEDIAAHRPWDPPVPACD